MSTIVTLNRGAQGLTPFGFNSGENDPTRGSAFFTDFYDAGPVTATNFAVVAGDGGVYQNSDGSTESSWGTSLIYTGATDSTMSFAVRFKMDVQTNTDVAGFGMAPLQTALISAQATRLGFTITQAAAAADDTIAVEFDDATTDGTATVTVPDDFDATDWHVYGAELTRDSQGGSVRNRADFFIDGKLVKTVVGSGVAMPAHCLMCNQDAGTSLATFDWASFSGPRPS